MKGSKGVTAGSDSEGRWEKAEEEGNPGEEESTPVREESRRENEVR